MRKLMTVAAATCCAFAAPAYADVTSTLNISATVAPECDLATGSDTVAFDLGTISSTAEFTSPAATVSFTCSNGTTYNVAAGFSANADANQRRLLGANTGEFLNYDLYTGTTGTTSWTDLASQVSTGDQTDLKFRVHIPAVASGMRPADTFTDSIILTISY